MRCVTSSGNGRRHRTCCSIDCLPRCTALLVLRPYRKHSGFTSTYILETAVMPKVKRSKGGGGDRPAAMGLAEQILQADTVRAKGRVKTRDSRLEEDDTYVDERLSRKILQQARIQQEELQTEYGVSTEKKKTPVTVLGSSSHVISSSETNKNANFSKFNIFYLFMTSISLYFCLSLGAKFYWETTIS